MSALLDSDTSSGTNMSNVEAIDVSLKKMDSFIVEVPKDIMSSLCADSSCGVTREGLANEMTELRRTFSLELFLVALCGHHGFNLMMAALCEKFFGNGSIKNRKLLRLLCTCCAIQKCYEMS